MNNSNMYTGARARFEAKKKAIAAAALAATLAISAQANAAPNVAEYCESIRVIAGATMELRQSGEDFEAAEQSARVVQALDMWPDLIVPMMHDAYDVPAYRTEVYRLQAIHEFSNDYYVGCLYALLTE